MKNILKNIKRLIRYIPVIWKSRDYDYVYAIELFRMKLEDIAAFLDSDKAYGMDAKKRAERIRFVTDVMKKVYNEEYLMSYADEAVKKWGEFKFEFVVSPEGDDLYEMKSTYGGRELTKKEQGELHEMMYKAQKKQDRAHKILWRMIERDIEDWWD